MNTTAKVLKYELNDVLRGHWLVAYTLFFILLTEALFRFGGTGDRALLSLTNVVLIIVPLVSILFGSMYLYGAREFNELLLSQPVNRSQLFVGLYLGLCLPFCAGFILGVGAPFLFHAPAVAGHWDTLGILLAVGTMLTAIFIALAFVIAIRIEDRVRGLGLAIALWLLFAVIYDGLILAAVHAFAAYPLEKPLIGLMMLNPVDLGRVLLLMNFDIAALMGYTGAVFQRFFGSPLGLLVALAALTLWVATPFLLGLRLFARKDF